MSDVVYEPVDDTGGVFATQAVGGQTQRCWWMDGERLVIDYPVTARQSSLPMPPGHAVCRAVPSAKPAPAWSSSTAKTCKRCGKTKLTNEFPHHPKTSDKLALICKGCKGKLYEPWNRVRLKQLPGNIYLILAENGLIKIGIANDVDKRFRSIQTQSPVKLVLLFSKWLQNANGIEAELHTLFRAQHSHGEWFRLDDGQLENVKEMLCRAA